MSMIIYSNNSIELDGKKTGFSVTQRQNGTVVYSAGYGGSNYKEHQLPSARYSLSHDTPSSGVAGRAQFESDLRELLKRTGA